MYEHLKKIVIIFNNISELKLLEGGALTHFIRISNTDLEKIERNFYLKIPSQLRSFYLEIGYGFFSENTVGKKTMSNNRLLHPEDVAGLINGSCEWMMPYTEIEPNTLPFFERDVDLFLCLRPNSGNPNAVYWMWGEKICDSLIEFFERLLEDPDWFNPSR